MKPLVLVILDGWGLSPVEKGNAILQTPTPNYDKLLATYPHTLLAASGQEVGLAWGEMGNSEVGHLNLGTGRVVMQDLPRIDKSIDDGSFFQNPALVGAFDYAKKNHSHVHLLGLCSAGGVHAHINHLLALLELAKKEQWAEVYLHLISDGRDTAPQTILTDLAKIQAKIRQNGVGQIASLMGRYFAMDRDQRMERTQKAYQVLTAADAAKAASAEAAINAAYKAEKSDEFIEPVKIDQTPRIKAGDALIFFNFRSDRARQIADLLIKIPKLYFATFTSYGHEPTPLVKVAFLADKVTNQLAMVLSNHKLTQFHLAETEKYAHVTYFFNGGWEAPFSLEERCLVQSPKVATYDLKPAMAAAEITQKFRAHFSGHPPNFTVLNFANADMVGHTGNFEATKQAIAAVDQYLGQLTTAVLNQGGDLIVTADHGNAEQMINPQTGEIDKEHTTNPVPLILGFAERISPQIHPMTIETKIAQAGQAPTGVLADVCATIIKRLNLEQPPEITGQDLAAVM